MNRTHLFFLFAIMLGLMPACGDHAHDEQGSAGERPTVAVTHWTDHSELFM